MALVRLERAARAGDAEELCGSVYRFQTRVPIPRAECARGLKDAFAPDGLSIDVRAIRFTGADRAVATAATVETDGKGVRRRSPSTTFRLERDSATWYVVPAT